MTQLSSPIVVFALSCTVPMCSVANSRMVLRSPITSSQGSPWYFLSWLAAPTEQNWKIRLSRPMVVWPSLTQCGPTAVPAPIFTLGPMTVYGPTVTEPQISALGSTTAVGWICVMPMLSSDGAHGAHELGLAGQFLAHAGNAVELENARLRAAQGHIHHQLVAGSNRTLETGGVDAGEVVNGLFIECDVQGCERQQRRGLGHGFQHQHARHHGPVREVANEKRLVDRHVLERLDALAFFDFEHAVHQQKGIAMRQLLEDLVDVHHDFGLVFFLHYVPFFSKALSR